MSWSASPEKAPLVLVVDDEDVVRKYMILITSASILPEGAIPSGSGWKFLAKPFFNGDLSSRVEALAGAPRHASPMGLPCPA